jgi:sterol desaturase/sphingolipid hydroxylase (fatty acid hydroxylase superfamily)
MAMPRGDSVQKVNDYYHYLQSRQLEPHGRAQTWHVDWTSLRWLWGFAIVLAVILVAWIREYRSTHPPTGISPLDRFGGYTTEAAGRVPLFFWLVTLVIVVFGAEFVIGHLISGQVF